MNAFRALFLVGLLYALATAQAPVPGAGTAAPPASYLSAKVAEMKWQRILPELGTDSPEITILRVDPKTQATQLMIRNQKAFAVPKHWHTANETHTILHGTFVFEHGGKRETLGPGSFNYIPSRMVHQAQLPPGGLVFITVDGAWDINWVDGPPQPKKKPAPPKSTGRQQPPAKK